MEQAIAQLDAFAATWRVKSIQAGVGAPTTKCCAGGTTNRQSTRPTNVESASTNGVALNRFMRFASESGVAV